jgi:hypothetical protein
MAAVLHQFVQALDRIAKSTVRVVGQMAQPQQVRNLLSDTNLGHLLRPILTDLPVGAWSMSALLDTVGGPDAEPGADLLVGAGILVAVLTTGIGLDDRSDPCGPTTRIGLVYTGVNVAALNLYTASLTARQSGCRGRGKALGLAGLGMLLTSRYLSGRPSFAGAVNVNHTALED